ncbi:MAG: sulfotransferase [Candidatus Thorarchaeota archaeon]
MIKILKEFKYCINTISNIHRQSRKKNIIIFSLPRSGSTWLMELIATQPKMKYYDEPLNIRKDDVSRNGIFTDWQELMPDSNNDEEIIEYLKKISKNEYKYMNPTPFRRNYRLYTNRIVFKVHEVEHMVNKIKKQMNAIIVLLFRHPIANTISRNKLPRLKYYVRSEYYRENMLNDEQVKIADKILRDGSHFEKGILSWCFQNMILIKAAKNDDIIITYEELVLNPVKTCNLIYKKLDLENINKMVDVVERPAHNIGISRNTTLELMKEEEIKKRRQGLVKKWKKIVSRDDINRAFNIIELFNIDMYCENNYISKRKYLNFDDTIELI